VLTGYPVSQLSIVQNFKETSKLRVIQDENDEISVEATPQGVQQNKNEQHRFGIDLDVCRPGQRIDHQ